MSVTYVTVAVSYPSPRSGQYAKGHVDFELEAPILDTSGNVIVPAIRQTITLDSTGAGTIVLAASDSTGNPANNSYKVTERILNTARRTYYVEIPAATVGTLNLVDATVVAGGEVMSTTQLAQVTQAALDAVAEESSTIAELSAGSTPTGSELVPVSQSGVTKSLSLTAILNALVKAGYTFTGDVVFDQGAAGVVRIQLSGGVMRVALFANNTDAQPIASLGSLLGVPLLGMGPGGSTTPDTFLQRGGVAEFGATSGVTIAVPRVVKTVAVTTNRTMVIGDLGKDLLVNQTALRTQTIPLHSSVAFPVGCFVFVTKYGTGDVAIAATGGVTLRDPAGLGNITTQYETRRLWQVATDEWIMSAGGPA